MSSLISCEVLIPVFYEGHPSLDQTLSSQFTNSLSSVKTSASVCLSLVVFFASGPYVAFVLYLLFMLFLSVATSHSMNDDISREMNPWLRSYARQNRMSLLRFSLILIPITLILFLFGFWW